MAAGSDARVGIALESVYGTRVAPTRFLPINSHTRGFELARYYSPVLGVGRNARPSIQTTRSGTTTITGDVPTTGFGFLLNGLHSATVTPTQLGGTAAYEQVHTFATAPTKSFTIQDQMPPAGSSTLIPHDLTGVMFSGITINWDPEGSVSYEIPAPVQNLDTTQTLATYVAPAAYNLFSGAAGSVTVAAVAETNVLGTGSFTAGYSLRDNAYFLGGNGMIAKPAETDKPTYTATWTADFNDNVNIQRVLANTQADVVIKFEGAIIAAANRFTLEITIPDCVFTSTPPGLDGPGIVQQEVTVTASSSTGDSPQIRYISTDVTL
jgi:hypothetical protein